MISFEFSSWSINKFYKSKIFEKYAYVHVYRAFLIMYLRGQMPPVIGFAFPPSHRTSDDGELGKLLAV